MNLESLSGVVLMRTISRHWLVFWTLLFFAALALPAGTGGKTRGEFELQSKSWRGDFDEMLQRRYIRALVVYSKPLYYVDKGRPLGMNYDLGDGS
jgi:hypothetical protein